MKVTREAYLISTATLIMVFTLVTVDIYKFSSFPFFGVAHWVPELCAIFLLSNYIAKNFYSKTKWSIFAITMAFPILFYQSTFGFLTSAIFSSVMVLGFLSVDFKKFQKMKEIKQK